VLSLPLLTVPVKVVTLRGSTLCSTITLRVVMVGGLKVCASGIVKMAKEKTNKTANVNFDLFIFLISQLCPSEDFQSPQSAISASWQVLYKT
jgi:hypothetical protein